MWEVAPLFDELLQGSNVEFVRGEVRSLDTQSRLVEVAEMGQCGADGALRQTGARQVAYDACVVALGAEPTKAAIEGWEHVLPFYSFQDALTLRQRLHNQQALGRKPLRVAVVGGGCVRPIG